MRLFGTVLQLGLVCWCISASALAQSNGQNPLDKKPAAKNPLDQKPAAAQPSAAIVMKLHTLTDKGMGNMESHTVLAPDGWTVEGGGWWPAPAMFNVLPSQQIKVTAPDGRMVNVGPSLGATEFRPSEMAMRQLNSKRPAEGGVDNGYPVMYLPDNMDEWKTFLETKAFRASFPKATNFQMQPVVVVPELTSMLRAQLRPIQQQIEQSNQQFGGTVRASCDCIVLASTCFYELDGKKWEHLIVIGVSNFNNDTEVGRGISWAIEPSVSYRAEAGQLEANMPLLMSIANSVRATQKWAAMKSEHIAKMNHISAKGAADRAAIIAQSNREISKMRNDTWNEQQASQDRSHYNFIKAIRGVEDYATPGGETAVQLPNNYSHIYTNSVGDYILTNDSLYNPNTDPNINNRRWDTMQPVPAR